MMEQKKKRNSRREGIKAMAVAGDCYVFASVLITSHLDDAENDLHMTRVRRLIR